MDTSASTAQHGGHIHLAHACAYSILWRSRGPGCNWVLPDLPSTNMLLGTCRKIAVDNSWPFQFCDLLVLPLLLILYHPLSCFDCFGYEVKQCEAGRVQSRQSCGTSWTAWWWLEISPTRPKKTSKLQKTKPLSLVFTNLRAIQKVKRIECKPNARWTPHSWLRQWSMGFMMVL